MTSKSRFLARQALWIALLMPFGIALVLSGTYLYLSPKLPSVEQLRKIELQTPMQVFTSDGLLIAEYGEKRRTPITYGEIPPMFEKAILAAEDNRFYDHSGVDMKGLSRAVYELIRYQSRRSGGSTITMQVARNFFLTREQTFLRKFNEIILALQIENELTKQDILELYVNKIYLGHRAYGIAAAAQVYYGTTIDQLGLAQLAMIAGLPKAPSAFNPITNPDRALVRRNWILGQMLRYGYIDQGTHDESVAEPVIAEYHGVTPEVEADYLAEMVRTAAIDMYGREEAYTQGLKFYTSIQSGAQAFANRAVTHGLHAYDERHGYRGHLGEVELPAFITNPEPEEKEAASPPETNPASTGEAGNENPAIELGEEEKQLEQAKTLLALLEPYRQVARLTPALVLYTDEETNSAQLFLKSGEVYDLPWDGMSWAAAYVNVNVTGQAPEKVSDVLKPGAVIMVRQEEGSPTDYRLAQVPQVQGALVVLDPHNGAVRALVGGYDFQQSNFNRAIQGGRQAGSIIKPFVYSSALSQGFTAASIINDAPIVYEDSALESAWRPENSGGKFLGPIRLRQALYQSRNLVSIRLLQKIGVPETVEFISRFGIDERKLPRDLSLALGSASLVPLELATAYSAFANGGFKIDPWFIERVTDADGNELFAAEPLVACTECEDEFFRKLEQAEASVDTTGEEGLAVEAEPLVDNETRLLAPRAVDERVVFIMNSMLQDVIKRGTGRKALALRRSDIAGKTGTTNEQVDAWFSGYNPNIVATAWVGFDNPETLGRREFGGTAALPIWMSFMESYLKGRPEAYLRQPDDMVTIKIDAETGERALPGSANSVFEIFRTEHAPEERQNTGTVEQVIEEESGLNLF